MSYWIYKCNSQEHPDRVARGDWADFFDNKTTDEWGSTEWTPKVIVLKPRDIIIAFQTNRNELVGLARVVGFQERGRFKDLLLRPIRIIGVKVRPLKKGDPKIAAIPALQPGPFKTIYDISASDAEVLLSAAGMRGSEINALAGRSGEGIAQEQSFIEGEGRAARTASRNAKLRLEAKKRWGLRCYCCSFDFEQFYGTRANGAGIVHHLRQFTSNKRRKATVQDVRVVCANCHYVLHLSHRPLSVDKLKNAISQAWSPWSADGIKKRSGRDLRCRQLHS